jgi:hypothetical protein
MIRHTVVFRLKHREGSAEEKAFLARSLELARIPGVKHFEQLRQTSPKTNFAFGFAMKFDDQSAYDAYNIHPVHVAYVRDVWIPEVADFMEIDYAAL